MLVRNGLIINCFFVVVSCFQASEAAHIYPERTYQDYWCTTRGGKTEVRLPDKARVDCVLNDYAIEFDFANKWSESIGQSLYYGHCLNKKSGIVLIMENYDKDLKYLKRLTKVANLHNITVWVLTPQDLN